MSQRAHTPPRTPATEPNSSSSTLVNHPAAFTPISCSAAATVASSTTPSSSSSAMSALDTPADSVHGPFSPSFDPNVTTPHAQTPLALRPGGSPMPGARMGAGAGAGGAAVGSLSAGGASASADPLWSQRLSVSFSTIADQIAAASRALAIAEVPAGSGADVAAFAERLEAVERAQDAMGAQLRAVQELLANVNIGGARGDSRSEVEEVRKDERDGEFKSGVEIAVEELQRQVSGVVETIRLE